MVTHLQLSGVSRETLADWQLPKDITITPWWCVNLHQPTGEHRESASSPAFLHTVITKLDYCLNVSLMPTCKSKNKKEIAVHEAAWYCVLYLGVREFEFCVILPAAHTKQLPPRSQYPGLCRPSWRNLSPARCQIWGIFLLEMWRPLSSLPPPRSPRWQPW